MLIFALLLAADITSGCATEPIAPTPPTGCAALKAICVCDSDGNSCHWVFYCIKDESAR